MQQVSPPRRAVLLGVALVALGCDVATFALDPKLPRFDQTWNLPATSTRITVAELLPAGNTVQIKPDSSAFMLTMAPANISRVVGSDCAACLPLNGTNAIKPAFTLAANNSTALPAEVVSATITNGKITITLTNNMSFDPIRIRTGSNPPPPAVSNQGHMVIVIRSGSFVLGRDSVNGQTTPWAPGAVLTRTISFNSGTATSNLIFDVTLNSPVGDNVVPINANGLLNASAAIDSLEVAQVGLNFGTKVLDSDVKDSVKLDGIDSTDIVKSAGLQMTFVNPFAVTGNLKVQFAYGPGVNDTVYTSITLPTGTGTQTASFNETQIKKVLGKVSALSISGSVTPTGTVLVTPKQEMTIDNRLVLRVLTPKLGSDNGGQ